MTQPATTTIFEYMSGLARALGAINLGQGFPEMAEPCELIEAAQRALVEHSNQYPPMRGLPELHRAIRDYYARTQGLALDDAGIVVTSGGTEALAASLFALVRPGDEVILVQPLYDAYQPLVEWAGGTARFISLAPPDWTFPIAALEAAIGPRTRGIILNTPNNPVGTMLGRATLEAIGALCQRHDLWVLCDEVWEGMVFDGTPHVSPLAVPSLADRAIKVGSAGKIFSMTGWKIGWALAAPDLAARIAARHQFLTFTTATPLQWAVAEAFSLPSSWHQAHLTRYAEVRHRLVSGLRANGFSVLDASATWFVSIDLEGSGLPADDRAISEALVRQAGVASIPVSAFYAENPETGYLRLCFTKEPAIIDLALERLARFRASPPAG